MLYKTYFDVEVLVEAQKITFDFPDAPKGRKPTPIDENNIRVELRTSRVFHKILNIINEHKSIFETGDYELLGEMLFKILFGSNETGTLLTQTIIRNNLKGRSDVACRIFLEFSDNSLSLPELPWEYTMLPSDDGRIYLSADLESKYLLIRRLKKRDYQRPPTSKLNVVVIINNKDNKEKKIAYIDTESFIDALKGIEDRFKDKFAFQLLENVKEEEFMPALVDAIGKFEKIDGNTPPYVIHYFGHAEMDGVTGKLVFNNKTDGAYWIEDEDFANYFDKAVLAKNKIKNLPELFLLQACNSAKIGDYQKGTGIALALAMKDIPAVIGMQNEIDKSSSTEFMKILYEKLLEGCDVAEAVTVGRDFLGKTYNVDDNEAGYKNNTFGSPVLFITTKEPVKLVDKIDEPKLEDVQKDAGHVNKRQCIFCANLIPENSIKCPVCKRDVAESFAKLRELEEFLKQQQAGRVVTDTNMVSSDSVVVDRKDIAQRAN